MIRTPRFIAVTGIAATALLGSTLVAAPAYAVPAQLTDVKFVADGDASDELSVDAGTTVRFALNDSMSGNFSFTGCWAVGVYDGDWSSYGSDTSVPTTWTAGAEVGTVIDAIDLNPAVSTEYDLIVWSLPNGQTCIVEDSLDNFGSAELISRIYLQVDVPTEAETMTLTGQAKLGATVTVTAKVPGSLVGDDFDLWACPDTTLRPDDNEDDNGACFGPTIQERNGADSVSFLLGYDPERDGTGEDAEGAIEFWQNVCDQYFIVHDYSGGGHSNWIGPVDCSTGSEEPQTAEGPEAADAATPELAATGSSELVGAISMSALLAMLIGGALLTIRRNREASMR